jgi:hypothetical protein
VTGGTGGASVNSVTDRTTLALQHRSSQPRQVKGT